jgi:hypothetical protein
MKDRTFHVKLGHCFEAVSSYLSDRDAKYKTAGPAFAIDTNIDEVDSIVDGIDGIITDSFGGKASKHSKYNYHQNVLYLQFKRHGA